MRKLDILVEKRGKRHHWYAVDMESKRYTHEGCCSLTGPGRKCKGFDDKKSPKQAGYTWNKIRRN